MKNYVCISNYFHEDELTVGKIYQGVLDGEYITIKNNNGYNWRYFYSFYFKNEVSMKDNKIDS